MDQNLLTAAQIAEEAGIHRGVVTNWVKQGKLVAKIERPRKKNPFRLFAREDAQPLIDEAKARHRAPADDTV